VSGQVVSFLTARLGNPIPSPVIMAKSRHRVSQPVGRVAGDNLISVFETAHFGFDATAMPAGFFEALVTTNLPS
jgi:hypothetical protein